MLTGGGDDFEIGRPASVTNYTVSTFK